jgi:glycine dehydrogenase subunit 1
MDYVQITARQRAEMLRAVGAGGVDDLLRPLFGDGPRPAPRPLELPPALDEMSLRAHVESIAARNVTTRDKVCFLGAGAYDHFVPAVVDALANGQAEFLTAYSPYQPEASQGALQAFFEWQTMLCQLTGMDVACVSLYDGAHALAEAAVMALGATGKQEIIVSQGVHPHYRAVLRARLAELPARYTEIPLKDGVIDTQELEDELEDDTAAIVASRPTSSAASSGSRRSPSSPTRTSR